MREDNNNPTNDVNFTIFDNYLSGKNIADIAEEFKIKPNKVKEIIWYVMTMVVAHSGYSLEALGLRLTSIEEVLRNKSTIKPYFVRMATHPQ